MQNGVILIEKENPQNEYRTKGIFFIDGAGVSISSKKLNIQLEPGDYKTEDLMGKTLIGE